MKYECDPRFTGPCWFKDTKGKVWQGTSLQTIFTLLHLTWWHNEGGELFIMPKALERRLKREAKAKGYTGKRANAFVYGTMRKTGWKPKGEK